MKTVYLAGPIHGKSDQECKGWRIKARSALEAAGHRVLDPMERDYRGREMESVDQIVGGDLFDISNCDCLLVNAEHPSWGTAMELAYAFGYGKGAVAFTGGAAVNPWLKYHCDSVCRTMEEAVSEVCR